MGNEKIEFKRFTLNILYSIDNYKCCFENYNFMFMLMLASQLLVRAFIDFMIRQDERTSTALKLMRGEKFLRMF